MILDFPAGIVPGQLTWHLRANTQTHTSPFDGSSQTLELPGARWIAEMRFDVLTENEWRVLTAFVARLGGAAGRFRLSPIHAPRRAVAGGAPAVNGAGQGGLALSTRGWAAGAVVMRAGDFLSYVDPAGRDMLHVVTADAASDGAGVAAIPIRPQIRRAPADGVGINIAAPRCVVKLADDDEGSLSIERSSLIGSIALTMEEALFG